ncbi:hypothetical protein F3J14_15525 [Burkholderia sp. Tr-862]|uniref:hypothetical protein n=1 Tax=Burkholderia sp. Tr-862 TaxID=2608331 RepID=UPI00141A0279|nr:hypothetical protein [Burkholderia sp. Tr-862]NIF42272.1 hypothetical protein [Burkholderia sp. Tr-862]
MSARLKVHWVCWGALTILFSVAVAAFELSRASHSVELSLKPGATISFSVFRLMRAPLAVGIDFKRNGWADKRPELGNYSYNSNFRASGYLQFKEPGEPITIRITSDPGMDALFHAMPRSRSSGSDMWRDLVASEGNGNPNRLPWPLRADAQLLPGGITHLTISVVDVGPTILSENVTFVAEAPPSGYGWLWWLSFWPLFVVPVAIYGGTLLSLGYRMAGEQRVEVSHGIFRCMLWRITKTGAATALAYPLSGLAAGAWTFFHDFPRASLLDAVRIAIWFGTYAPTHGVLPDVDSEGHYYFPAYHFVIPTAAVLIFLFFRGWRLFKPRRSPQ